MGEKKTKIIPGVLPGCPQRGSSGKSISMPEGGLGAAAASPEGSAVSFFTTGAGEQGVARGVGGCFFSGKGVGPGFSLSVLSPSGGSSRSRRINFAKLPSNVRLFFF